MTTPKLPQSKSKKIDGKEYFCTPFLTTKMTIHFISLTKMIGVPLAMVASPFVSAMSSILGKIINKAVDKPNEKESGKPVDEATEEKTGKEDEENEDKALFDVLPQALKMLLSNIDEKTVNEFILELLEQTQCETTDLSKPANYDIHFAGKLDLLLSVLYFVIETNYGGIKKFIM